jgi:ribosome-associated translation inhibitor RaiA
MNAPLAPQFPIYLRGLEGDFRPDERAFVRHKLARRLNKFAESIERVSLRTEDVNGPRGGVDRVCRIKVVVRGMPSIVLEKQDAFLNTAVDLALAGVERSVRRAVQRRRARPLRPVSRRPSAVGAFQQHERHEGRSS